MSGPLPDCFRQCDFVYADIPWRNGWSVFEDRAHIEKISASALRSFDEFLRAVNRAAELLPTAVFALVMGKREVPFFPKATRVASMHLNGWPAQVVYLNGALTEDYPTAINLLQALARRSQGAVGDFCCGYGRTGLIAKAYGKPFVLSDYNDNCIRHIIANPAFWV